MSGMIRKETKRPSRRSAAPSPSPVSSPRMSPLMLASESPDVSDNEVVSSSPFEDVMEQLQEKRASTREAALTDLRSRATSAVMSEDLADIADDLLPLLARSLKRGGNVEVDLAADTTALLFVSLDRPTNDQLGVIVAALRDATRAGSTAAPAALALCCLLASDDIDITLDALSTLGDVIIAARSDDEPAAITAALDAYGLLATTVSRQYIQSQLRDTMAQTLLGLLRADDLEIRIAAGELAALLVELSSSRVWRRRVWRRKADDDENGDENNKDVDADEDEEDEEEDEGDVNDIDFSQFSELRDELEALATESDRRAARRDRTRQRAMFRDISEYFETGNFVGTRSLRFGRETAHVTRWAQAALVEALTRCLGVGLHVHAAGNSTVQELLGIGDDGNDDYKQMTAKQRSLARRARAAGHAANAKERSQRMGRQRSHKASAAMY